MDILKQLYDEVIGFFGIGHWVEMMQKNDYSSLLTFDGVIAAIGPLIPLILLIEIFRAIFYKKFKMEEYKIPFIIFVANRFISRFIAIAAVAFCIGLFEKYAIFKTGFTWYWLIYGYIVWELAHFVYHYLGHKVRLFWCLHSTHHAPETMNLSVTFAHFFLEAPYADFIRTSICILLGVNPPLLFFIMFIDGTWGAFIHVGENFMKDARMGFLNKIILTPSHHRVHHQKIRCIWILIFVIFSIFGIECLAHFSMRTRVYLFNTVSQERSMQKISGTFILARSIICFSI